MAPDWFLITLLPTLNIIPLVVEHSFVLTAEHFLYFPIAGIFIFSVESAHSFIVRYKIEEKKIIRLSIFVFIVCAGISIRQNNFWKDEVSLFKRSVQYESLARVDLLLAKAYYFDGQIDNAIIQGKTAITRLEGYLNKITDEKVRLFLFGIK